MDQKCLWKSGGNFMKFKFMIEIASFSDIEETNSKYNICQEHIQDDVEEALRDYGLNVLNIEAIKND
jgi:hypothetical protein